MAKGIDQVDSNVKIGVDYEDLRKAMSEIQKGSEKATKNLKSLNDGYKSVINDTKQATTSVTKTIKSAAKELKALSLELKSMTTLTAGTKALKNQAAFKGYKTNLLFGDLTAFKAQLNQVSILQQEIIRNNTKIADSIQLKNVKYKESLHTIAGMKQANKAYLDYINYGTEEGLRRAELKRSYAKQKVLDDIKKYEAKLNPKETSKELTALERAQAFRLGNIKASYTGTIKTIDPTALKDLERMEGLDRRLGAIQIKLMANYKAINMVTGAFRYLLNYTVEYDKELHQLQAIAAVSDTTMAKLKDSIQAVASSTKFTSLEVAQAGTVLAQAGLSARQIEETLPAIAKLATATGTDLATSTDVVTSTLNIYSLQASEAEHVTNALTTAMNESKADIGGFQKAIQYAGNYAAQLGVTYEETAAVISAATQAGIRSRSMLGTGLRAVLAEFLNPTKKLTAQLEKVGLTVSDIDVRSKGLSTVLKTLKESGFGATEAFRGMERRGAAFLASIIKQTDFIDTLREHMAGSTAAAEANEIQMNSLSAQIANFKSIAGTAASDGVAPLNKILVALLKTINGFMSGGASKGGKPDPFIGGVMSALFGATGVAGVTTSIAMVGGAIATMANQIRMLEKAAEAKGVYKLLTFLSSWKGLGIITVLGGIASAAIYAADKLGLFTSGADKARAAIEEASGEYEEAKEKGDSLASMYERLFNQREKLQDQTERDIFLREILTRFPQAAQYVDDLRVSFEDLVDILTKLKALNAGEQAQKAAEEARKSAEENYKIVKKLGEKYFEDTTIIGSGVGEFSRSEIYDSLITKLQQSNNFKGLNFQNLRDRANRVSSAFYLTNSGKAKEASRYYSQGLYNELKAQLNFNTTSASDLLQQYGRLSHAGLSIGGKEGEALMAVIKQLGEEVQKVAKSIDSNETKITSEIQSLFADKKAEEQKRLSELSKIARDTGDAISKQIKETGTDNEETEKAVAYLMEEYRQQRDLMDSMDLVRNPDGSRKEFKDYSIKELAAYRGMQESDIQQMIDYFKQNGETDEEHIKELIAGDQDRNEKLDSIRAYMEVLENSIRLSSYGATQFERVFTDLHYKDAIKALKSIPTSKDLKQANQAGSKYLTNMAYAKEENIVKALSNSLSPKEYNAFRTQLRSKSAFQVSGDLSNKAFDVSKAFNQESATEKVWEAYQNAKGMSFSKDSEAYKAISTQMNAFSKSVSTANREVSNFVDKSPKLTDNISAAQTGMESFFHKLNTDIKEIDMAYTNATRSMDQMLAAQQGLITGLERAYGSGSVAVQAAQVRLQKMQDAQLSKRNAALETKLSGYTQQLEILRGNPEYQKAKQLYDNAFEAWKKAEAGGDQKVTNQAYKNLQSVSKGWDKLATKEESLTSKIADLQDEIIKNTEAINKENEEKRINTNGGNPFTQIRRGFGDAATIYMDEAQKQGYGTLRGEAGIMGKEVIQALDDSFVTLFDNITSKSKTAKESFKEFGQSIIQTIGDIAKQLLAKQIVMSLLSGIGGLFGGGEVTTSGGGWSSGFSSSALGGLVTGPIKNRDSVPTMLMPGEYVLKKSAVDTLGRDYLDSLNNKSATVMAGYASEVADTKSETTETGTQSKNGVVNVYVVAQEQQQQMTPQDVVVTITQDMITGGQTKKLVKSIAMGAI